jgi:putative transposase
MPRPARLNLPGIPQHVTQRGNNRQACFFSADDYRLYLDLLSAACHKHDCALHAYVLMTNHVHLLLTPGNPDGVSRVVRDLGRDYVRTINRNYRRSGTLWEGRYKSSLIDEARYCLACYRYIELNPVRAGMVRHPGDYPWSSFRCNTTDKSGGLITPHACWQQLGASDADRRAAYTGLFSEALNQHLIEHIRYSVDKGLPTGNDRFRREVEQALAVKLGNGQRGRPRKTPD